MKKKNLIRLQDITFGTIAVSSLFVLLGANGAFATTSVVDDVTVTVPASCTMSTTVNSNHTATVEVGSYVDDIGETTFKVTCNDSEGFSVYAVGFTNDEFGNTTMKPSVLADTNAIATGLATSGDTSNWAMKLTAVTGDYAPTLETGFNAYHVVPAEYTKVASYSANTDSSSGSSFKSTYAAYVASAQPADTYTGKVKYTIVHPANANAPERPTATLNWGSSINARMKNLANSTTNASTSTVDNKIKSIRRATELPDGFVASEQNTISATNSAVPVYIFFDDTDNAGIMYYYAEGNTPIIASGMDDTFSYFKGLKDVPGLSDWDVSKVTSMNNLFSNASSLTDISGLSNWDTSKVEYMSCMFYGTKITNTNALAPNKNGNPNIWNTGNVKSMGSMFSKISTLTDISGLSNWDTAKVTDMEYMFSYTNIPNTNALITGKNGNPNIWNTGNVKYMSAMFQRIDSLNNISGLSNWDTSKVVSMQLMFEKDTALTSISPISGWDVSSVVATAGDTSSSNRFKEMFYMLPLSVVSNFSFTSRPGRVNSGNYNLDGTYVPSS